MAGIRFELRKAFGKKTLVSNFSGVIYASLTTIGPALLFTVFLCGLRSLLSFFQIPELENLFFISSFTYLFFIAIFISGLQNTVLSRYVSDKIFENKEEDICASVFGSMTVGSVLSGCVGLVLVFMMYFQEGASWKFLFPYYCMCILATSAYTMVTYISALKQYKEVALVYAAGVAVIIPIFLVLYQWAGVHIISSIYWALVIGFFLINMLLVYCCLKAFGNPSNRYYEYLNYYKEYSFLVISGLLYIIGMYSSNVVYWFFSDMGAKVSIFRTAPNYDFAMFLGMLINLSAMVIFEVKAETNIYDKYISYISVMEKGTYDMIEKARLSLQNTLNLQLFFVYEIQLIITVVMICMVMIFHPYLNLSSEVLNLFLLSGMGIYCALCMYVTVVFLYYFEDHKSACISLGVFAGITLAGAFLCGMVFQNYYGVPVLAGALMGWIVAFFLLRKRLRTLTAYLFCK